MTSGLENYLEAFSETKKLLNSPESLALLMLLPEQKK